MSILPRGTGKEKIAVIGEAPSAEDINQGMVFSGYYGRMLSEILEKAGLSVNTCYLTHAIKVRCQMGKNTWFWNRIARKYPEPGYVRQAGLDVRPEMLFAHEQLLKELEHCEANVLVPLGEIGLWCLLQQSSIFKVRGSVFEWRHPTTGRLFKVIPTHSPEEININWEYRFIVAQDFRRVAAESGSNKIDYPEWRFLVRPSFAAALQWLEDLRERLERGPAQIAVDIETRQGHIACLGIARTKLESICIPFMCVENPEGYWSFEEEFQVIRRLKQVLTHPNAQVVGQNFHYDLQYIVKHWGFRPNVTRDTLIMQHVSFPGLRKSLDFLASLYCTYYRYWKDEGKSWEPGIDEEQLWSYNCQDCVYTLEVAEVLEKVIDLRGVRAPHEQLMRKYWLLLETMLRGVRVHTARRDQFRLDLMDYLAELDAWFIRVLGHQLNPKSPKQMATLFYEDFKLTVVKHKKTKQPTCDDSALELFAKREPLVAPLCEKLSEYRTVGIFLSNFVNASLDWDKRMRCFYGLAGTETFRLNSSKDAFGMGTNLQNIPANKGA